jgi:hypothetical protein
MYIEAWSTIKQVDKSHAPLISPALYDNGIVHRKNEYVTGWSFLALDFDVTGSVSPSSILPIIQGYKYALYTTASATITCPKFRLFIPFTRTVLPKEMKDVWHAGFEMFDHATDQQCKDLSRGYYVPGIYPGAFSGLHVSTTGLELDPDLLIEAFPPPPPASIQQVVYARPNNTSSLCSVSLNSPIVSPYWVDEYLDLPSGQGLHFKGLYIFMVKVAGAAVRSGITIDALQLSQLASSLDLKKDGRWHKQHRSFIKEAKNAIDYAYNSNSFKWSK